MAFYKVDINTVDLMYAPNFVYAPGFSLTKEDANLDTMEEQGGWKWFVTDDEAYTYFAITPIVEQYPIWAANTDYERGDIVQYLNNLFKVNQEHKSQIDWIPSVATKALYSRIGLPGIISEWVQPESTNPYMLDDQVTYNGQTWKSTIDNNVWAPGVYGWVVV